MEYRLIVEEVKEPGKVQCHHDIYSQRPEIIPAVTKEYLNVVLAQEEWNRLKKAIFEIK